MATLRPFLDKRRQKNSPQYMENPLPKEDLFTILRALKPLRQACCHFQIGNQLMNPNQHVMSLREVQESLRSDVHNDCETALRELVASRNAVAGILILQKRWKEASEMYQKTLDFCGEQKREQGVETDALQQIHCLANMVAINDHAGALSPQQVEETKQRERELCRLFVERSSLSMKKAWKQLLEPPRRNPVALTEPTEPGELIVVIQPTEQTPPIDPLEELKELTEQLFQLYEDSIHVTEPSLPLEEAALLDSLVDASDESIIRFSKTLQSKYYGNPERKRPGNRKTTRVSELQQSIDVLTLPLLQPSWQSLSPPTQASWRSRATPTCTSFSGSGSSAFLDCVTTFARDWRSSTASRATT